MSTPTRPEHPEDEVLAALVLAESPAGGADDVTASDRGHVDTCARCTAELEELRHTVRLAFSGPADRAGPSTSPAPGAWAGVAVRLHEDPSTETAPAHDLSPSAVRRRRSVPLRSAAALAAACLVGGAVVGGLLAGALDQGDQPPVAGALTTPPAPAAVQLATGELGAVDGGRLLGTATVSRTGAETELVLRLPPLDPEGGYLEVWMLDPALEEMVSVGVVGDSRSPHFTIPQRLLENGYVVVDVSRQSFDGGPAHSGDSLARGTLTS